MHPKPWSTTAKYILWSTESNKFKHMSESIKSEKKDLLTDIMESFVIAMAVSIVVYFTLVIPNQVDGESMEPNFHPNELLLTNKAIQWLNYTPLVDQFGWQYQRGDIIIFRYNNKELIKRIIAIEGEKIKIHNGKVYINGKELKEDYLPEGTITSTFNGQMGFLKDNQEKTVPQDSYFVMGDNRQYSKDSRFIDVGFIPLDKVRGKVILRYWPFDKFTVIPSINYIFTDNEL